AGEEYCVIIDLSGVEVLQSQEYVTRLNSPTPWTTENSKHYLNFYRCALSTSYSWRVGNGGFLASVRIDLINDVEPQSIIDDLWRFLSSFRSKDTVALSIGAVNTNATAAITKETEARRLTGESVTDLIVFVEAISAERAAQIAE